MTTKKVRGPKGAAWAIQAFERKMAKSGGVIRRSIKAAKKAGGLYHLISIALAKGYTVQTNGGQIIICCNKDPVLPVTSPSIPL